MTRDQRFAMLLFIATYTRQNGYPPSYREVGEARGITGYAVRKEIAHCIDAGIIGRPANKLRSLAVNYFPVEGVA